MQKKIYAILIGNAPLMAIVTGVFDGVPDNQAAPYITIGDDDMRDFSSHTHDGFEGFFNIHVWSEANGRAEAKDLQVKVYELLENVDLAITGFETLNLKRSLNKILKDPDGKTHHGISRFDFLLGGN